jgi:hypothetical protein
MRTKGPTARDSEETGATQRARDSARACRTQRAPESEETWALQRARDSARACSTQRARALARACGVLLIALLLPATALGQVSTSAALSRRPWVGFWLGGSGTFHTELPRGGLDTQLSVDLPIARAGGLRLAAGRAWANEDGAPDMSIQRVVVYTLIERVVNTGVCVNTVYSGFGAGLYVYDFADMPDRIRKTGYHVVFGSACILGRVSTGIEMHGRFIKSPGLAFPRDRGVTVIDLLFGVRVRL